MGEVTGGQRRIPRRAVVLALAWLLFAYLVAPLLIRALYQESLTTPFAELNAEIANARQEAPLAEHLDAWRWFALWPLIALMTWIGLAALTRNRRVVERHVLAGADARSLAGIRILACLTTALILLWEDPPSTALMPAELRDWDGLLGLLRLVPGFTALISSSAALRGLESITLLALLAAAVGWRVRLTLPVATTGYLVLAGLLRLYSRLFHTGLVPLYLLVVLCFLPCGDALRLGRRRDGAAAAHPAQHYGWSRWACWAVVALTYFEAGLSKLRSGGLAWWHADNLRAIVYHDGLSPMHFDFDLGLRLAEAPSFLFAAMGLAALAVELGYPAVLVSRWGRRILPLAAVGMHVGILFFQNVAFFDLLMLQAMFGNWRMGKERGTRNEERVPPPSREASFPARSSFPAHSLASLGADSPLRLWRLRGPAPRSSARELDYGRKIRIGAGILLLVWAFRIEAYPLSAMQMYAQRDRSGTVEYVVVESRFGSGASGPAPLESAIRAMADSRYRWLLRGAFDDAEGRKIAFDYLRAAAAEHNRGAAPGDRITAFTVDLMRWDFRSHPWEADRRRPGVLVDTLELELSSRSLDR